MRCVDVKFISYVMMWSCWEFEVKGEFLVICLGFEKEIENLEAKL
jgi:hypothetical protein